MIGLNDVRQLYQQYLEQAMKAEQNQKLTDGMFGFGKRAADDPCHTAFNESLQDMMAQFADEKPDSTATAEVLAYIYRMPTEHQNPLSIYWMLIAAHGTTEKLIGHLTPKDASVLLTEYGNLYRRWERLPVQKNIYRALKEAAKTAT